jgi:hypothetical protein
MADTTTTTTPASDARHPQEIRMRTDKVKLENAALEDTARRIAEALQQGRINEDQAEALSVWEASVAEARACVAKLAALLESHDTNRQPTLTAALTWAVLDAKLPEPTELRPGWILPAEEEPAKTTPVPHIWALTAQPAHVLDAAAAVYGEGHPRAAKHLVTDLGGFPVSHLVDYLVLGQRLRAGKTSAPRPTRAVMMPTRAALYPGPENECGGALREEAKELITKYATTKEMQMVFENARYVAHQPREYLRWAVPTEVRAFLYPLIVNGVFKNDPTRVEYVRIEEEDVARIIEAQQKAASEAGAGAEPTTASAASTTVQEPPHSASSSGAASQASSQASSD